MAGDVHLQALVEDFHSTAALLLGAIHGKVRVPDEHLGCSVVCSGQRHAYAGAGRDELSKDFKRPLHLAQNAAGHHVQIAGFQNVFHQNGKFVATQPASRVLRTQRRAQPVGYRNQHHIARRVTQ